MTNDTALVSVADDGTPTTTSLIVAEYTGNKHKSVRELIEDHQDDFTEFGVLRFQTAKPSDQGGRPQKYAILNEDQAYLLVTYLRNSEIVRVFKKRLVHAFSALRNPRLGDPLDELEASQARTMRAIEIARAERARAEKAERVAEAEQKHRRAIEGGDGIDLTTFGKKYFSEVPAHAFYEHLYKRGYLIDQRHARDGRPGLDHRKPAAKGREFIYAHDDGLHGGRRRFTPRVRPQREIDFRDRLAADGLPVNEHSTGLVLITDDELKELES